MVERSSAPFGQIVLAFAGIYLIWGSTYLAIRFAVESLPVFSYAGVRFVVAGAILYAITRARGAPRPTREHWVGATVVGALLLLGGNGGVSLAELTVPSGIAAVLIATVPFWMVFLHWGSEGARPSPLTVVGLVVGLGGVALLVLPELPFGEHFGQPQGDSLRSPLTSGPTEFAGGARVDPFGAGVLLVSALAWAAGSLYARRAPTPPAPILATGMQQLAGGALLLLVGVVTGELAAFRPEQATPRSLVALAYLVVFGSLLGFTAYIWLLRRVQPALVATYAYVNPVVAVFLGWTLASEPITPRTLVAAAVIVAAVAIITTEQARVSTRVRRAREAELEPEGTVAD